MRYGRWIALGLLAGLAVVTFGAPDAGAAAPGLAPKPSVKPGTITPARPQIAPVMPKVFAFGPCSPLQTQCYLTGGKVPALAKDSPDQMRSKVCALPGDPRYGCGSCERCPLIHTAGALCSPKGCDYKECEKDWTDADGNRKNGCEQYKPKQPSTPAGAKCTKDADCSYLGENDGLVRHPHGECKAAVSGADARGCLFVYSKCAPFQTPSDETRSCQLDRAAVYADLDGDGFNSGEFGGEDCDDGDPARFPGNRELCDTFNHDEDCDPRTHGGADADGDGQADGACCNVASNGSKFCGTDCDDKSAALALAAQRCTPDGSGSAQVCEITRANGGQVAAWVTKACGGKMTCKPQPSGAGVCQ